MYGISSVYVCSKITAFQSVRYRQWAAV